MAFTFDNKIKKALGKSKSKKPFSFSKIAKTSLPKTSLSRFNSTPKPVPSRLEPKSRLNIKGASIPMQKKWKSFTPEKKIFLRKMWPDSDKDGVPNRFDCRPFNPMEQDSKLKRRIDKGFKKFTPKQKKRVYEYNYEDKDKNKRYHAYKDEEDSYGHITEEYDINAEGLHPLLKLKPLERTRRSDYYDLSEDDKYKGYRTQQFDKQGKLRYFESRDEKDNLIGKTVFDERGKVVKSEYNEEDEERFDYELKDALGEQQGEAEIFEKYDAADSEEKEEILRQTKEAFE